VVAQGHDGSRETADALHFTAQARAFRHAEASAGLAGPGACGHRLNVVLGTPGGRPDLRR
jgi:hypothetical protein